LLGKHHLGKGKRENLWECPLGGLRFGKFDKLTSV